MNERWATIDRPIGRSAKDWKLRSAGRGAKGKLREAVTDWENITSGEYNGESFSYLKLKPKTGRTHQLRVHLKSISRPIVADKLYASSKYEDSNNLDLSRLALHSFRLSLLLPNGEEQTFEAPIPTDIDKAITKIAK